MRINRLAEPRSGVADIINIDDPKSLDGVAKMADMSADPGYLRHDDALDLGAQPIEVPADSRSCLTIPGGPSPHRELGFNSLRTRHQLKGD